jgi:hypothetical protein
MPFGILADIVVLIHLSFVLFAVLGAVLIIRYRWVIWLHLPTVLWAVWIEMSGGICPLTPLENRLRLKAGLGGYQGDFVENYLLPVLYPAGLTRGIQILLGAIVLIINLTIYAYVWYSAKQKSKQEKKIE